MPKAIAYAGDTVIADSDDTVVVEGNHYFPIRDVRAEFLKDSDHHTTCHWKGEASYKHVDNGSQVFKNAAFIYLEPSTKQAQVVKGRMAFWQGIRVEEK